MKHIILAPIVATVIIMSGFNSAQATWIDVVPWVVSMINSGDDDSTEKKKEEKKKGAEPIHSYLDERCRRGYEEQKRRKKITEEERIQKTQECIEKNNKRYGGGKSPK